MPQCFLMIFNLQKYCYYLRYQILVDYLRYQISVDYLRCKILEIPDFALHYFLASLYISSKRF